VNKRHVGVVSGVAVAALALTMAPTTAQAGPSPAPTPTDGAAIRKGGDSLPNPLADAQAALRQEAVTKLLNGQASLQGSGTNRVIKIAGNPNARAGDPAGKSRWVWYPTKREESIFTILVQFGTKTMASTGGTAGPQKNQIPSPDRKWDGSATDDNSTYWVKDFNTAHYKELMFGSSTSFKDFYLKQSQGRFLAKGDVADWVQVPYNEARYGSNELSDSETYWPFIEDSVNAWYANEIKMGKTKAQIATYLKQFDKVDRYDYDGDGNFTEPDGYIDHFQDIHAGEGEEAGGGAQGEDAIWSHRWYVNSNLVGSAGPSFNKLGGAQIGNSGIWVGDYTTEPENGGLGVFTHEFGHDLGLRDYYDTDGGDNSSAFWTLMSSGSWLNRGGAAIGTVPGYMGPHEKLLLGWLDYNLIKYSKGKTFKPILGPANKDGQGMPQAIAILLPDREITVNYNTPYAGSMEWWGGSADNLTTTMSRSLDLTGASTAKVSTMLWADIEEDYDYLYAEASTNGGSTWSQVGNAVTGQNPTWVPTSWDLSAYAGKKIDFRFRYATDGGVHFGGPFLDNIVITKGATTILTDGAESDAGWTTGGWTRMTGTTSEMKQNYYLIENRVYSDYDSTLKTGPYNFGWADTRPNWVERFPYQNGMLVWYVDTRYDDNNTSTHPGAGFALPVDLHPEAIVASNGMTITNRRGAFDATFGLERTDKVTWHKNGVAVTLPSRPGVATFDDSNPMKYWSSGNPMNSVQVAGTGTMVKVLSQASRGWPMNLMVTFK
jgi:immune inhibitor A